MNEIDLVVGRYRAEVDAIRAVYNWKLAMILVNVAWVFVFVIKRT